MQVRSNDFRQIEKCAIRSVSAEEEEEELHVSASDKLQQESSLKTLILPLAALTDLATLLAWILETTYSSIHKVSEQYPIRQTSCT